MRGDSYLLSLKSLRTSFKYVLRMFSTEKTKQYWYSSRHSRTLEKSFSVSSLPFLSTFERWTTFWRLDFGILCEEEVEGLWCTGVRWGRRVLNAIEI